MKTGTGIYGVTVAAALLVAGVAYCGDKASQPLEAGFGPSPTLVAPKHDLVPTINVAKAVGWPRNTIPLPAAGLRVNAFARGLDHPRWLYVLPNGDVLVAETNAPAPHDEVGGFQKLKNGIKGLVMKRAGAAEPSPDRIVLLRDTNGDGIADVKTDFLTGLTSPFGMALVGNELYVADTDALIRYPYQAGETKISVPGVKITALPAGPINHHWTKNLVASPDGRTLYVAVGSNSNVGENGLDVERDRARIVAYDIASGQSRPYATGLRNPVGMAWQPDSEKLWVSVNERDELGSDLVPDYMTEVHDGAFYGWPFSYYGQHPDMRVKPLDLAKIRSAVPPDYALGAHTASLGLTFMPKGSGWPTQYSDGAFIGQHGSWNREPRSGYDVVFVPFENGRPSGKPQQILSQFLNGKGEAQGRPVGVVFDKKGALLVADDVGNEIWRVVPAK